MRMDGSVERYTDGMIFPINVSEKRKNLAGQAALCRSMGFCTGPAAFLRWELSEGL
jgi:hypothetical protein